MTFCLPVIQLIQCFLLHICCQSQTPHQRLQLVKAIIKQGICPLSYINMAHLFLTLSLTSSANAWECGENTAVGM